MGKIDEQAFRAVHYGYAFKQGNTQVITDEKGNGTLLMYGHPVVKYDPAQGGICMTSGPGKFSNTIKSRLRAFLKDSKDLRTKQGQVFLTLGGVEYPWCGSWVCLHWRALVGVTGGMAEIREALAQKHPDVLRARGIALSQEVEACRNLMLGYIEGHHPSKPQ